MTNGRIDENGLPVYAPGDYDFVRVVDRSTGASRNALAPEVTSAARELSDALGQVVADAEADIAPVIAGLGYLPPVPFASGLTVDSSRFTVSHGGEVYAPVADALPFTTTGTFNPAQWRVIQGVTGPDLAAATGAGMVGYGAETVADVLDRVDASVIGDPGKRYRVVAGVLRNIGGVWQYLVDSAHDKVGGFSVAVDANNIDLNVNFSFTAGRVLSLVAVPDESYARAGITFGASVGVGRAQIRAYAPLEFQIETNGTNAPIVTANPHIAGRITATRSGATMRVTWTGAIYGDAPQITPLFNSPPARFSVLQPTGMNILQYSFSKHRYKVAYSGGAWVLATNDPNATLDTSTFAASGNVLVNTTTLTDGDNNRSDEITVASRYGQAAVNTKNNSSFTLRFYTFAGELLKTEANGTMEAYVTFGASTAINSNASSLPAGTYAVRRGNIPIYWNELSGTTPDGGSANIWIIGVFEV